MARGEAPSLRSGWTRVAATRSTAYRRTVSATWTPRTASISFTISWACATGWRSSSGLTPPCTSSICSSASGLGYPMETRAMKRSRWASGSGYVPSISTGFWVATTMNGLGSS
ncbi:hypothetical protein SGLAM104S_07412 [Streptomyces glaucescens]